MFWNNFMISAPGELVDMPMYLKHEVFGRKVHLGNYNSDGERTAAKGLLMMWLERAPTGQDPLTEDERIILRDELRRAVVTLRNPMPDFGKLFPNRAAAPATPGSRTTGSLVPSPLQIALARVENGSGITEAQAELIIDADTRDNNLAKTSLGKLCRQGWDSPAVELLYGYVNREPEDAE